MPKENIGLVIKEKTNIFAGLKELVNIIINKKFDDERFEKISNKYNFDITIIKRLYSYIYGYPRLLIYINKYMNNLYTFNKYTVHNFIKSFHQILIQNNIIKSSDLYYIQSSSNKCENRQEIMNLLQKYFHDIYNINFNEKEIKFYYKLYLNNIITDNDIIEIDKLLNNNKQTLKIKIRENEFTDGLLNNNDEIEINNSPKMGELIKKEKMKSNTISIFIDKLKTEKLNKCKTCKLFNQKMVVLDTNLSEPGEVDVAFIALNPGLEEAKYDQPLTPTGKSGQFVRDQISQLNPDTKWVIYNSILCSTKNKLEIGTEKDVETVRKHCSEFVDYIDKSFPAKLYILIGADAAKVFNIEGSITKISGVKYGNKIPVIHPSGMRNVSTQTKAKNSWAFIRNEINSVVLNKDKLIDNNDCDNISVKVENNKKNNSFLQLLDIRELDNKTLLYIFTDEEGNKIYEQKPYLSEVKIKKCNYDKCDIITNNTDLSIKLNKQEKYDLIKLLKNKMNELKQV